MGTDFSVEQKWNALTSGFDSVGFVISEAGQYEEVIFTAETESLLYGTPEEIEGSQFHDILPASMAEAFLSVVQTAIETGESQSHEYPLAVADETRWFDAVVSPLPDDEDNHVLWMARDVTQRKRQELELERYQTIVEASGDLIYIADEDGQFTYVNSAFADALGYEREAILGEHATLVMDESDIAKGRELISSLLSSGTERGTFEMDLITADGVHVPCENHIVLLPYDEEFRGSAGVLRDITERREREQQLAVLDRVLRHNLRNDMNLIIGNAQRLTRQHSGEVAETAGTIASVATELLDLVDKERELADLLSESPPKRPYHVKDCLAGPLAELRDRHPDADISATVPEAVSVIAVPQLERAILELGENAIQHTDREQPTLHVDVGFDDDRVELRVADGGPGMPDNEREILLGEKEIGPLSHGQGIGLRLVEWIVTLAGGQLAVADNDPRGTIICVSLSRTDEETA